MKANHSENNWRPVWQVRFHGSQEGLRWDRFSGTLGPSIEKTKKAPFESKGYTLSRNCTRDSSLDKE